MKVILDANVLLSFLAAPSDSRTVVQVVQRCLTDPEIQLLAPRELITEVIEKATGKPYFQQQVPASRVSSLVEALSVLAEIPAQLREEVARFSRDRKDDYLVAYGLVWGAEYLVTGDKDLLVLKTVRDLKIVKPVEFLKLLHEK